MNANIRYLLILSIVLAGVGQLRADPVDSTFAVYGTDFDFGKVPFNTTIVHRVRFINNTSSVVHIVNVDPECNCTQIPLTFKQVNVGDTADLAVTIKTGLIPQGDFIKSPSIETDAKSAKTIKLTLRGSNTLSWDPMSQIQVNPKSVTLKKAAKGSEVELQIKNNSNRAVIAKLLEPPSKHNVLVEFPAVSIAPKSLVRVKVKLLPNVKESDFEDSFTIGVNDDKLSRFTIPITMSM